MKRGNGDLRSFGAFLDGAFYNVLDFPYDKVKETGPSVLRKKVAYRIETDMTKGLFPYRGIIGKKEKWNPYISKVGIYMKELNDGVYQMRLAYPHTPEERVEYSLDQAKDFVSAVINQEIPPDQFSNITLNVSTNGKAFMPPIHEDDDFLNMILKLGIRLKEIPFELYGKRIEAAVFNKSKGTEGINAKNNAKRGIITNKSLSSTKFCQFAEVGDMEAAIILRDKPNSPHPMFEDGTMLIMYPLGEPFEIESDKLLEASDLVMEAINESVDEDENGDD